MVLAVLGVALACLVSEPGGLPVLSSPEARSDDSSEHARVQWRFYVLLQQGRYREAAGVLDEMRGRGARDGYGCDGDALEPLGDLLADLSARYALETRDWKRAMDAEMVGCSVAARSTTWYARGLGAARSAWPGGRPDRLALAREAVGRLEELGASAGRQGTVEIERLGVLAAIAAAQEEREEMHIFLTQAIWIDERRPDRPRVVQPVLPIRELAGDLWLLVARFADARDEYATVLQSHSERARALIGLARAAARDGDRPAARDAYRRVLDGWRDADADRPELAEARQYLESGGA
jgi:tetratricopeptide (TPR) repeat protein